VLPLPPLPPPPGTSVGLVSCLQLLPQLRLDWGDANRNVEGSSLSGSNAATRETSDSSAAMPIAASAVRAPRLFYTSIPWPERHISNFRGRHVEVDWSAFDKLRSHTRQFHSLTNLHSCRPYSCSSTQTCGLAQACSASTRASIMRAAR
jgi:hypothetical protein